MSAAPGELCITFAPGSVTGSVCADAGLDCKSEYWVLDTDYESYTVTYNCVQILELREETAFILTRDPNPAPEVVSINPSLLCSISIILNLSRLTLPSKFWPRITSQWICGLFLSLTHACMICCPVAKMNFHDAFFYFCQINNASSKHPSVYHRISRPINIGPFRSTCRP